MHHKVGSQHREVANFYGVVELDHYLNESIQLALQLRKNLTIVKFLAGKHFGHVDHHIHRTDEIRMDLKKFSSFVQERKTQSSLNMVRFAGIDSEDSPSDDHSEMRATDYSRTSLSDMSIMAMQQMLNKHCGSEMSSYSIESAQFNRLEVQSNNSNNNACHHCDGCHAHQHHERGSAAHTLHHAATKAHARQHHERGRAAHAFHQAETKAHAFHHERDPVVHALHQASTKAHAHKHRERGRAAHAMHQDEHVHQAERRAIHQSPVYQAEIMPLAAHSVESVVHLRLKSGIVEKNEALRGADSVHESASCAKYRAEFVDMRYYDYSSGS